MNFKNIIERIQVNSLGMGKTTYLIKAIQQWNIDNPDNEGILVCSTSSHARGISEMFKIKTISLLSACQELIGLKKTLILYDNSSIDSIISMFETYTKDLEQKNYKLSSKLWSIRNIIGEDR